MSGGWMRRLAQHFEHQRRTYPDDHLLIVFDIDGTIVDLRFLVHDLLRSYDLAHGTAHFRGLDPAELDLYVEDLPPFLGRLGLRAEESDRVVRWFREHSWSDHAILASHRPFAGVLGVIRWFQLQERASVGLNTGRAEAMRQVTLDSLNALGREFRVRFSDELLMMHPTGDEADIPVGKALAIERFRAAGYRVIAMVDNEPENLRAVSEVDGAGEILLLHADTIFRSHRTASPSRTVSGRDYDLAALLERETLPRHIDLVWQGLHDEGTLGRFLASNVRWGELDVRLDAATRSTVTRGLSLVETPLARDEELLELGDALSALREGGKRVRLHLTEDGEPARRALDLVAQLHFEDDSLWFRAGLDTLQREAILDLRSRFPHSLIEVQVDFLAPLLVGLPEKAAEILTLLRGWTVDRVAVSWGTGRKPAPLELLEAAGFPVDLCDIPDLEAFLQAALLHPRTLSGDFAFTGGHLGVRIVGDRAASVVAGG